MTVLCSAKRSMKGEEDSEAVLRGGVEEEGDSTVGLQCNYGRMAAGKHAFASGLGW